MLLVNVLSSLDYATDYIDIFIIMSNLLFPLHSVESVLPSFPRFLCKFLSYYFDILKVQRVKPFLKL